MFKMIKQSIVCAILKELIKMKKSMTSFCTLKRLYFFPNLTIFFFIIALLKVPTGWIFFLFLTTLV